MADESGFRRATVNDADAVLALVCNAYAKWVPIIGRPPRPMTADYAKAVIAHRIDLIHRGGTLAGLIEFVPENGVLLIENVAVAPALQGQGIGRLLMTHAESVATEYGARLLRLYTNGKFTENISLYQHLGYHIDSQEPFDGSSIVHMSKSLTRQ